MTKSSGVRINLSIDVPDLEQGLAFYCGTFDFEEISRPFPTMAVVAAENLTICIHQKAAGTRPSPEAIGTRSYERHWTPVHLDFHVPDFEERLALAQKNGAKVEQTFDGRKQVAFLSDPFGNGFCLLSA